MNEPGRVLARSIARPARPQMSAPAEYNAPERPAALARSLSNLAEMSLAADSIHFSTLHWPPLLLLLFDSAQQQQLSRRRAP